jgi:FkbM family methyltransferase
MARRSRAEIRAAATMMASEADRRAVVSGTAGSPSTVCWKAHLDVFKEHLARLLCRIAAVRSQSCAAGGETLADVKSDVTILRRKLQRARQREKRLQASALRLKSRVVAKAGQVPSARVLEEVLELRLSALQRRCSDTAVGTRSDFMIRSAAYREAIGVGDRLKDGLAGPGARHGLRWWVPSQAAGTDKPDLRHRMLQGWLPLKDIVACRPFAVGTVMLDIGANIGSTAIPRIALGDFQCVYAAEPEPANYTCLVQNIVGNGLEGRILPDRAAIDAVDGHITFTIANRIGCHRVTTDADRERAARGELMTITVPCWTLDTWISLMGIDPAAVAFIKCDVQGREPHVLRGAPQTLAQRHIVWQLEVSPKHLSACGSSLPEFCALVGTYFDCFIDLRSRASEGRPTSELQSAMTYLGTERRGTDIIAYNVSSTTRGSEPIDACGRAGAAPEEYNGPTHPVSTTTAGTTCSSSATVGTCGPVRPLNGRRRISTPSDCIACGDDSVSEGCVMLPFECPLVSRVREIRTHGLNGVVLTAPRSRGATK